MKPKVNSEEKKRLVYVIEARWHIALVQDEITEENNLHPVTKTVGLITLEDVIEEMLQREIIEETDLFSKLFIDLEKKVSFDCS